MIPGYKFGNTWRIKKVDFLAYTEADRQSYHHKASRSKDDKINKSDYIVT